MTRAGVVRRLFEVIATPGTCDGCPMDTGATARQGRPSTSVSLEHLLDSEVNEVGREPRGVTQREAPVAAAELSGGGLADLALVGAEPRQLRPVGAWTRPLGKVWPCGVS